MKTQEEIREKITTLTNALPEYKDAQSEAKVSTKRIELLSAITALRWVIGQTPIPNVVYRQISELETHDEY